MSNKNCVKSQDVIDQEVSIKNRDTLIIQKVADAVASFTHEPSAWQIDNHREGQTSLGSVLTGMISGLEQGIKSGNAYLRGSLNDKLKEQMSAPVSTGPTDYKQIYLDIQKNVEDSVEAREIMKSALCRVYKQKLDIEYVAYVPKSSGFTKDGAKMADITAENSELLASINKYDSKFMVDTPLGKELVNSQSVITKNDLSDRINRATEADDFKLALQLTNELNKLV